MRVLAWTNAALNVALSVELRSGSSPSRIFPTGALGYVTRPSCLEGLVMSTEGGSSGTNDDGRRRASFSSVEHLPASSITTSAHGMEDQHKPAEEKGALPPPVVPEKEMKKMRKKAAKAAKREKRESNKLSLKPCVICNRDQDLLIRCQVDSSLEWKMVCGKCWREVSGGVVDGDAAHPHYRYGGLWKAR